MLTMESAAELLARAEMHEQLAAATDDIPARKMHQAMAAEYRRKAAEPGIISEIPPARIGPVLKLNVALE
jgi:hypothetical protein